MYSVLLAGVYSVHMLVYTVYLSKQGEPGLFKHLEILEIYDEYAIIMVSSF